MTFTRNDLNHTLLVKQDELASTRKRRFVDAAGKTLGRLAVEISKKLNGKHKASYTDFWDAGDFVIVVNTAQVVVTGNKALEKMYYKHSGFKGHLKEINFKDLLNKNPNELMRLAVKGMIAKNKLREPRLKRLKLFATPEHNYKVATQELTIN
ncbi:MAG: hypothetical protein RL023_292 [Candidatus Parcubacteria bacterium]|jgi:large subunit ribosomal protein L13